VSLSQTAIGFVGDAGATDTFVLHLVVVLASRRTASISSISFSASTKSVLSALKLSLSHILHIGQLSVDVKVVISDILCRYYSM
jgi:hypothetical protein